MFRGSVIDVYMIPQRSAILICAHSHEVNPSQPEELDWVSVKD
jgi:hypothetical protein